MHTTKRVMAVLVYAQTVKDLKLWYVGAVVYDAHHTRESFQSFAPPTTFSQKARTCLFFFLIQTLALSVSCLLASIVNSFPLPFCQTLLMVLTPS